VLDGAVVDAIAGVLLRCKSILFITGAGLSADSGLPTYRGIGGLYDQGGTEEGLPIEVVLSGEMLGRRPDLTWKYIHQIERACRGARPNRGHEIIAEFQSRFERVVVLTQNVDGFHREAGSKDVIEIHGDIHLLRCTQCRWQMRVPDYAELTSPPYCPQCSALVRPAVVLFGEMLPDEPCTWLEIELARGFDAVFLVGTSAMFPYIVRPVLLARAGGRATIEINPSRTDLTNIVDFWVAATARDSLLAVWQAYTSRADGRRPEPRATN
jgi:NAD-dependent deacetylase